MINAGTVSAYLTLDISDFQTNISTAGQQLEQFKSNYNDRSGWLDGTMTALSRMVTDGLSQPMKNVSGLAGDFGEKLRTATFRAEECSSPLGAISGVMENIVSGAVDLVRKQGEASGGFDKLKRSGEALGAELENTHSKLADVGRAADVSFVPIGNAAKDAASSVRRAIGTLPGSTKGSVREAWNGMRYEIESAGPRLSAAGKSSAKSVLSALSGGLESKSNGTRVIGSRAMDNFRSGMEGKKPNAVSTVNGIMQSMLKAAGSVSFRGIGGNMVSGIISGINAKMPSLVRSASSMASSAISTVRRALGINSPSRVMMEVGRFTAEGMEAGLKQGARDLYATASAISDETAAALSGISVDSRVSYDPGVSLQNRLDRLLDAVEKIAGSQTTMEIDGRPFGRLVREALA